MYGDVCTTVLDIPFKNIHPSLAFIILVKTMILKRYNLCKTFIRVTFVLSFYAFFKCSECCVKYNDTNEVTSLWIEILNLILIKRHFHRSAAEITSFQATHLRECSVNKQLNTIMWYHLKKNHFMRQKISIGKALKIFVFFKFVTTLIYLYFDY